MRIPILRRVKDRSMSSKYFLLKEDANQLPGVYTFYGLHTGKPRIFGKIFIGIIAENYTIQPFTSSTDTISISQKMITLGLDNDYYYNAKQVLGRRYENFLVAIQDFFTKPKAGLRFLNEKTYDQTFSALMLDIENSIKRNENLVKSQLEESNKDFEFNSPKFSITSNINQESLKSIDFDFSDNVFDLERIIVMIGRNGSGKTRILHNIAFNFESSSESVMQTFNYILAISYNIFDHHNYPKDSLRFKPCGIIRNFKFRNVTSNIMKDLREIHMKERIDFAFQVLDNLFEGIQLSSLMDTREEFFIDKKLSLAINNITNLMSGGQIYLFSITLSIISNIGRRSLLLIDEIENMTHPSMLILLMKNIYKILEEYDSYAIFSTHSPFVVQNIPASNVKIIERIGAITSARPPLFETLGADIEGIIRDAFYTSTDEQYYVNTIKIIADRFYDPEDQINNPSINLLSLIEHFQENK